MSVRDVISRVALTAISVSVWWLRRQGLTDVKTSRLDLTIEDANP